MSEKIANLIARLYRPAIEERFKDHPQFNAIMEVYDRGDAPPEFWDLMFAEAEALALRKLTQVADSAPTEKGGVIRYEVGDRK